MKFNKTYFVIAIVLFLIEIGIAKYTTGFIRHTIGDYLCVMLLYAIIKSFVKISVIKTAILVLLIAYVVEFLQLSNLKNFYPDKYANTLKLVLGTSFSMGDLVAYTLGIATVILIEKLRCHFH
ncbi:DUF2809 domain-containing protein [Polaribacter porphyrae]|uniref:DUF2809 domain-containing protein n=1 Tax=Polaribacter porphyrae TaxID=1137780 RepID=A0A2S7WPK5_9FLAO|nr:DUF2809 domain-containing protein [Polaribacter porphyrae]PQJ79252.1 hypothetical protein BTO18_08735 [Polaribacter porphyrae]